MVNTPAIKFCRLPEVLALVGYKRSAIYALIKAGKFPQQIKLSPQVSVWTLESIHTWMNEQVSKVAGGQGVVQ